MGIEKPPSDKSQIKKEETTLTRRVALGMLGAAAIGGGELVRERSRTPQNISTHDVMRGVRREFGEHPLRPFEKVCKMPRALVGHTAAGLTGYYLGHEGKIPEHLSINFTENLAGMWADKIKHAAKTGASFGEVNSMMSFADARVSEYAETWEKGDAAIETMRLSHAVKLFSERHNEILRSLNWGRLQKELAYTDQEINTLGEIASKARGRSYMAYSMTELMPYQGDQALRNAILMDFLYREMGAAGVSIIPCLSSSLIDYGPFQFTKLAIEGGIARTGPHALALNRYLPEEVQTPDTIEDFRTLYDHSGAAVLFGLQNITAGMTALKKHGGEKTIEELGHMNGADYTSVLAAHHYRPSEAQKALVAWATSPQEGRAPYYEFCHDGDRVGEQNRVRAYAEKSHSNYEALEEYLPSQHS